MLTLLAVLIQAPSQGVSQYVSVSAPVVALTRVQLIDGTGSPARQNQTVILRGGRIEAAGPEGTTPIPQGATVLDLAGHTVIPGLVSLHEHTYFGGVRRMTQMSRSGPLLYLAYGVTTAMTAGAQFPYQENNLRRAVEAGVLPGPRFFTSGPYLISGPPRTTTNQIVNTPEEVRRVIGYWVAEGATWFKFGGQISRELLKAGIEEAHARGARVTGHLCSVTFAEASALGIDLLQHGFITASDYVAGKEPDVCPRENMRVQADVDVASPEVQASIRAIVAGKAAVASTLGVYETFIPERARLSPAALELLDPETRKEVEANHAGLAQGPFTLPPRLLKKMMEWERAFVAAGGLLGAGSDPWGTGFLPGLGNLRNYELLVEAGFTPEQAVQIISFNGAKILGQDRDVGSIAPGKRADVVVIRGDPVTSPASIMQVVTVFREGVGYDSAKLRAGAAGRVGVN
jgi:enamidase